MRTEVAEEALDASEQTVGEEGQDLQHATAAATAAATVQFLCPHATATATDAAAETEYTCIGRGTDTLAMVLVEV